MPRRKKSKGTDYTVGYRRPPKRTQYKEGQSGNPKGRPKGSRPVGALLQEIIQQKVSVTENGRTRRLPALEIMLRRLANDAMRGEQRAIKFLLSLLEHYGASAETRLQLGQILAEDAEILAQYLHDSAASDLGPRDAESASHDNR